MKFNKFIEAETLIPLMALQMIEEDSKRSVLVSQNVWDRESEREIIPVTSRYLVIFYDKHYGIITVQQCDTILEVEQKLITIQVSGIKSIVWDAEDHQPLKFRIVRQVEWEVYSDSSQLQLA
jgi:hypothetical protein